jgi:glycerol-3-phosphate dehydrogenase
VSTQTCVWGALQLHSACGCSSRFHSPRTQRSAALNQLDRLMETLLGEAEAAGSALAVHSRFVGAYLDGPGGVKLLDVEDTQTGEVSQLSTRWLVNAAGKATQSLGAAS